MRDMADKSTQEMLSYNEKGVHYTPLFVIEIDDNFLLAVHQGGISEFDMVVLYRQKNEDKWSKLRTPKHIHWAVDVLVKLHEDREKTQAFLEEMIQIWNAAVPLRSAEERVAFLNKEKLTTMGDEMARRFEGLNSKGEYSVKFLTILAILLMTQEKTNRADAYMFGRVLEALKEGEDIFGIVSSATYSGR